MHFVSVWSWVRSPQGAYFGWKVKLTFHPHNEFPFGKCCGRSTAATRWAETFRIALLHFASTTENYSAASSGPFGASGGISFAPSAFFLGVGGKPLSRRKRERERGIEIRRMRLGEEATGIFFPKNQFLFKFSGCISPCLRFRATFSKSGTLRNAKLRKQ
jgi:hypothetical protein